MLTGAFLCAAGFAGADGRKAELTARRARPQFGAFVFVCLASSLAAAGEVSSPNRAEPLFAWRVSVRRGNKHTLLAQSRSYGLTRGRVIECLPHSESERLDTSAHTHGYALCAEGTHVERG